jgi:2,4-diaminopentanoate dehydrogenase
VSTRVVQWATGTTGRMALRAVIEAPDLVLVGVRVYDGDKVGQDAGALAGTAPTGVVATDRTDDVLGLDPDVVLYMGSVERYREACVPDVTTLLAAGIDVISTGSSFIDVRAFDPEWGRAVGQACAEGSSTFLGLGLYPGFWGEAIAPVLSRLSFRCDGIAVRESLSYAGYPSREMMFDVMGYGSPPESEDAVLGDATRAGHAFSGTAVIIAKALGLEVASIEPFREVAITDSELHVAAGVIPAGTVGAIKLGIRADCGPIAMTVEHVTWMGPDVAPEWSRSEGYEIELDGAPTLRCNLVLGTKGEDHTEMGCLATAMHAVHAIPVVVEAPPGILDLADATGFTGRLA